MNAPIAVFAYNRLESLRKTIESIKSNDEYTDSDLFVFVDGTNDNKIDDDAKVNSVREYVKTISGFKNVHYYFSDTNKGLGPSIITGVSKVINEFGNVIVLEDDLIISQSCLAFLNQGLARYKDSQEVFSICAYTNKITVPKDYVPNTYFCGRSSSWGWATWADRWNSVDWNLEDWESCKKNKKAFNKWGGSDCFSMLQGWKNGLNKSWAIRFCYSQFVQNKVSLFPVKSLVMNEGFDGTGTNCKSYNRFKCEFVCSTNKQFTYPDKYKADLFIRKSVLQYHSIWIRIWSKAMNIIMA